jgi:hypothetical protein
MHLRLLSRPATHVVIAIAILVIDYFAGTTLGFPIFFVIPVLLSAWFCHPAYAYALAVIQPLVRFGYNYLWDKPWVFDTSIVNGVLRTALLLLIAYLTCRTARQGRELKHLKGLLPICAFCKKIRDENERWQPLETYISEHSDADFTHSFCPDCVKKNFPAEFTKFKSP